MNCACGTLETQADVEGSKLMPAEGKRIQMADKVAEIQPKTIEKRSLILQDMSCQV